MMSFKSEITGHFTSAPFMYQELADKRVHRVLNSYDVFGGPHTFNVVWATAKLYKASPRSCRPSSRRCDIAMKEIHDDPAAAAALWVKVDKSKLPAAEAEQIITAPENTWTTDAAESDGGGRTTWRTSRWCRPRPASWKDMFIDAIHNLPGS